VASFGPAPAINPCLGDNGGFVPAKRTPQPSGSSYSIVHGAVQQEYCNAPSLA